MSDDASTAIIWRHVDERRVALADLLADLAPDEWATPSLCPGWTVRDVAGHLAVQHRLTAGDVLRELVRARGNPDRMGRDSAIRHARSRSTDELVEEVRSLVGHRRHVPVISPAEVLTDLLVHARDIADPLERPCPWPPEAAVLVADRLWHSPLHLRREFSTRKRLEGCRLVATDADWSAGTGAEVSGSIDDLVMLMARRESVLPRLTGPGADLVRGRLGGGRAA